jgi:hypothetical protein
MSTQNIGGKARASLFEKRLASVSLAGLSRRLGALLSRRWYSFWMDCSDGG